MLTFKTCDLDHEFITNLIEEKPWRIRKKNYQSTKCRVMKLKIKCNKKIQNKINNNKKNMDRIWHKIKQKSNVERRN